MPYFDSFFDFLKALDHNQIMKIEQQGTNSENVDGEQFEWDSLKEVTFAGDSKSESKPKKSFIDQKFEVARKKQIESLADELRNGLPVIREGTTNSGRLKKMRHPDMKQKIREILNVSPLGQRVNPNGMIADAVGNQEVIDAAYRLNFEESAARGAAMEMERNEIRQTAEQAQQQRDAELKSVGDRQTELLNNTQKLRESAAHIEKMRQLAKEEQEARDALPDVMQAYWEAKEQEQRNERAREAIERDFNSEMTNVDDLVELADAGDKGLSSETIDYRGRPIKIVTASNYPLKFLQHALDYRLDRDGEPFSTNNVGANTAQRLLNDPSMWTRRESETSVQTGFDEDLIPNRESNGISTSYIDTDYNLQNAIESNGVNGVTYLFSHIPADSLVLLVNGDAGSSANAGRVKSHIKAEKDLDSETSYHISGGYSPEKLAQANGRNSSFYNETLLRRYDQTGNPLLPNAILAYDGNITENAKKHAAFFNVPIINIETAAYRDARRKHLVGVIDAVPELMTQEEWHKFEDSAVDDLRALGLGISSLLKRCFGGDDENDRDNDIRRQIDMGQPCLPEKEVAKLGAIFIEDEPKLRLSAIESKLLAMTNGKGTPDEITVYRAKVDDKTGKHPYDVIGIEGGECPTQIYSNHPEYNQIKPLVDAYEANGGKIRVIDAREVDAKISRF